MLINKIAMVILGIFFCTFLIFSISTNHSVSMDLITDIVILVFIGLGIGYFWEKEKKQSEKTE
jgi:ABC-type Mn2+/Zn2+ transport system permease subunit